MTALQQAGRAVRCADAAALAAGLQASRHDTLATFAACERALAGLDVPERESLNPPLWELGHIGWFQEFWVARNPQRQAGAGADPAAPRGRSVRAMADALYDSSRVPHDSRWSLPLPDADATRADLASQLRRHALLAERCRWRRCVAVLLPPGAAARGHAPRGRAVHGARPRACHRRSALAARTCARHSRRFGVAMQALGRSAASKASPSTTSWLRTRSTCQPRASTAGVLNWAEFLPFVEAGGYGQPAVVERRRSCTGVAAERPTAPRYLRRAWQGLAAAAPRPLERAGPDAARLPPDGLRGRCLVPLGRSSPAERGRVGTCRRRATRCIRLGPGLGVDRQPFRALPWLRGAPVSRLLGAVVRRPRRCCAAPRS